MSSLAEAIRAEIDKQAGPADETVIRFRYNPNEDQSFTFAAIYINDRWYLTGEGQMLGKRSFTHAEFMRVLALNSRKGLIWGIGTATAWEAVL